MWVFAYFDHSFHRPLRHSLWTSKLKTSDVEFLASHGSVNVSVSHQANGNSMSFSSEFLNGWVISAAACNCLFPWSLASLACGSLFRIFGTICCCNYKLTHYCFSSILKSYSFDIQVQLSSKLMSCTLSMPLMPRLNWAFVLDSKWTFYTTRLSSVFFLPMFMETLTVQTILSAIPDQSHVLSVSLCMALRLPLGISLIYGVGYPVFALPAPLQSNQLWL